MFWPAVAAVEEAVGEVAEGAAEDLVGAVEEPAASAELHLDRVVASGVWVASEGPAVPARELVASEGQADLRVVLAALVAPEELVALGVSEEPADQRGALTLAVSEEPAGQVPESVAWAEWGDLVPESAA